MVDLVKIRKKAKKDSESATPREPEPSTPSPALDAAGEPPAAEPEVERGETQPPAPKREKRAARVQPAPPAVRPEGSGLSKLDRFREQAGRLRDAVAVSPGQDEEADPNQIEVLSFVIAGEQYAADIEKIIEIVRPRAVTRVPNSDASIVGIVSLRGMMVTLVDIRRRLRHVEAPAETPDTRVIVVDHDHEILGFEVDRVLRVLKLDRRTVEPHPVVHNSEVDGSLVGVFRYEGALTILLDFDKLLAAAPSLT